MRVVRPNRTKRLLKSGGVAIGVSIASPAPELVEIAAVAGCDYAILDAEHEPFDDAQLANLIRAADAFDITPIVRIARDPDRILRLLDVGAQGIHVPRCSSVEDMRELVACTRFFPLGDRTFYRLGRGGNFSYGLSDDEWSRQSNEELLVTAQVEEASALPRLEPMLGVEGIDVIHVGPKDLWQSLGMPPQEEVDAAIDQIATAVGTSDKCLSFYMQGFNNVQEQIDRCYARGARMIAIPILGLLAQETAALLQTMRNSNSG